VVNDTLDCLAAQANCGSFVPPASYPGIRGVMTRPVNWNASNGYNFANAVAPLPGLAAVIQRGSRAVPLRPAGQRSVRVSRTPQYLRQTRTDHEAPAWPPMSADSPFLRPGNGGNTAWVTTTSNAITRATAPGGIATDMTLEAGTWRSAFIAAATGRQLAANCAATPADDAEPIHKSRSVIAFTPALNGAGCTAAGLSREETFEWDGS